MLLDFQVLVDGVGAHCTRYQISMFLKESELRVDPDPDLMWIKLGIELERRIEGVTEGRSPPTEFEQEKVRPGRPTWSSSRRGPCEQRSKVFGEGHLQKFVGREPNVEGRSESWSCIEVTGSLFWNTSIFTTCWNIYLSETIGYTYQSVNVLGAHLKDEEGILAGSLAHQGHLIARQHLFLWER